MSFDFEDNLREKYLTKDKWNLLYLIHKSTKCLKGNYMKEEEKKLQQMKKRNEISTQINTPTFYKNNFDALDYIGRTYYQKQYVRPWWDIYMLLLEILENDIELVPIDPVNT